MDYKDIFRPDTLEKLNKRSQENLKKMMGDKTLMQTMMSSTRLLQEIIAIEAPYKDQLEQLAVQMAEDMYPIITEDGINIDAKIVSIADVNKSLDEIKIEKPLDPNLNKLKGGGRFETDKYIVINNFGKITIYSKPKDDDEPNPLFQSRNLRDIQKWLKNPFSIETNYEQLNESSPEAKRRVINSISQGAALHGTFSFYMFKEYLDAIDDTLVEKYNQLMKEVFGVYDDDNAIAMFLQMIAQGQKMGGGSSKVVVNEIKIDKPIRTWDFEFIPKEGEKIKIPLWYFKDDIFIGTGGDVIVDEKNQIRHSLTTIKGMKDGDDKRKKELNENTQQGPTIQARAICFPMLVHEIIKGLYELVSLQGFSGTKDQNQAVVDKVDKLENEPHDLRYGKFIYDALNDIYAESGYDDSRIREFFFAEVYQLGDQEFVDFVENALNDELTPQQKSWIKQTLKEIQMDLRDDDFDATGLDEIKIENPSLKYYPEWLRNMKLYIDNRIKDDEWGYEPKKLLKLLIKKGFLRPEVEDDIIQSWRTGISNLDESKSPCWDGYKKQGTKIKKGKKVGIKEAYINNSNKLISKGDFCVIQNNFHGKISLKDLDKINIKDYIHFENNMNDWNYRNIIRSLTKQFTELYNNSPLKSINDKLKKEISISPGKIDGVPILYITLFGGITSPPRPYYKSIIPNYFRDFFTNEKLIQKIKKIHPDIEVDFYGIKYWDGVKNKEIYPGITDFLRKEFQKLYPNLEYSWDVDRSNNRSGTLGYIIDRTQTESTPNKVNPLSFMFNLDKNSYSEDDIISQISSNINIIPKQNTKNNTNKNRLFTSKEDMEDKLLYTDLNYIPYIIDVIKDKQIPSNIKYIQNYINDFGLDIIKKIK